MTTDDKIRGEKLRYDIDGKAAKISSLSSRKIDKHEYLTDKETQPPDHRRVIKQAKFAYSPLKLLKNKQKPLKSKEKTNRCYDRSNQKTRDFEQ